MKQKIEDALLYALFAIGMFGVGAVFALIMVITEGGAL